MLTQKRSWKELNHLIWPCRHWLGNILEFSFEQKVIQKQPRILRLKASRLKRRDFSGLLNRILKRDFYILGPTQGSEGKGAIRQLKLFLSSKRIWLKNVQVSWTSDGCSILLLFILIPEEILMNCPCSWRESVVNCVFHNSEPVWSKLVRYWWQSVLETDLSKCSRENNNSNLKLFFKFRWTVRWRSEIKDSKLEFFWREKIW